MPVVLPHSIVYRCPKTGSTALQAWLRGFGTPKGSTHWNRQELSLREPVEGKITIFAVRHPVTWLLSLWRFFYGKVWDTRATSLAEIIPCHHATWEGFLDAYATLPPGVVGRVFDHYDQGDQVLIAQQEHLEEHMREIFSIVEPDLHIPKAIPVRNASLTPAPEITPVQRSLILEREADTLHRYNYRS